ncbi:MAG: hypothetical protein K2W85_06470 [Phycisphaerales bacterium]|nr:hypothetical protein [Phycisphaerales bacterium]
MSRLTQTTAAPMRNEGTDNSCQCIAEPLRRIFQELRDLLLSVTPAQYTRPMGDLFFNATVGGHVRHTIDHARALIDGRVASSVDYDTRQRGTPIESDPAVAMIELDALIRAMDTLATHDHQEVVTIAIMPTRDGRAVDLSSTLGRELAFVLSHTIHHNASIRGMVLELGLTPPPTFGYAPSTLAHQDSKACAR